MRPSFKDSSVNICTKETK